MPLKSTTRQKMKKTLFLFNIVIISLFVGCQKQDSKKSFSFAYITDTHITSNLASIRNWELPAERKSLVEAPFVGYKNLMSEIKKKSVDFILTGGDNTDLMTYELPPINGKLPVSDDTIVVRKYIKKMKTIEKEVAGLPIFYTIGNHDCYVYPPAKPNDPLYGQGLFIKYFGHEGKSYYSFNKNGWHFIVLSTHDKQDDDSPNLVGISDEQINWLKNDLSKIDKTTPIILTAHVPFPLDKDYENESEIIYKILSNYNVKLVLFGHWHGYVEFLWHNKIPCIIGSSASGAVWSVVRNVHDVTYHNNADQGYLIVNISGEDIVWKHYPFSYSIEKYYFEQTGKRPSAISNYWFLKHKEK